MNYFLKGAVIALLFCNTLSALTAQVVNGNSPYSRFGIGDMEQQNNTAVQSMGGGVGVTYNNPFSFNVTNPASLGHLSMTAYELSLSGKYADFKAGSQFGYAYSGSINNVSLAFPLFNPLNEIGQKKKRKWKWGMAVSLNPYSSVGYDVRSTAPNAQADTLFYKSSGGGGINQLGWSNGFKYKNFSAGLAINYLFGRERFTRQVDILDPRYKYGYSTRFEDDVVYSGFSTRLGAQYEYVATKRIAGENDDDYRRRDKLRVTIGATVSPSMRINSFNDNVRGRTQPALGGAAVIENYGLYNAVALPTDVNLGVQIAADNNWLVGAQYTSTAWSQFVNPVKNDSLRNVTAFRVGGQWIPDYKAFGNYWKHIAYRAGVYSAQDPRVVSGRTFSETGATVGFGLPLRLPRGIPSFINIGFDFGQRGNSLLLTENYTRFNIGFTLNDNTWFYHPKFN